MKISIVGESIQIAFPYNPVLVAAVKDLPGRRFDGSSKTWSVPVSSAAAVQAMLARLTGVEISYANGAQDALQRAQAARGEAVEASRAQEWAGEIPRPTGLAYLPYQRAGIAYALGRPGVLIADEMGLGKTIQAIGVVNADETVRSVLIVCPASLKLNWAREWSRWSTRGLTVGIANGALPATDVVILNYDILKKHLPAIHARAWDCLILDEAHYLKNPKAQRTQCVLGAKGVESIKARRRIALTGTPILNRPIEAWPIAHALAPAEFGNWRAFVTRYCGGYQDRYGWNVSGATNLPELQDKLRASIMVRRLKKDVLTELPAKRRQVIELPANGAAGTVRAEADAYAAQQDRLTGLRVAVELAKAGDENDYAAAVDRLRAGSMAAFAELSKLRHTTALAKIPHVIEHIRDTLESEGKLIVFAHHRDVIESLAAEFPGAAIITGDTPMQSRQDAVDRFQTDPACRLFLGNIQAAGVGLTLTASAHVVFAELDWVPGNITQAEDRCHRIGQTDSVLVQHLVLEGSLDATMARTLVEKQTLIDAALDDERGEIAALPLIAVGPDKATGEPATVSASRARIAAEAEALTPERIAEVHTGLRRLAGMCDGAHALDGYGFNKLDVGIGHSLAEAAHLTPKQAALGARLVNKYRRQLA